MSPACSSLFSKLLMSIEGLAIVEDEGIVSVSVGGGWDRPGMTLEAMVTTGCTSPWETGTRGHTVVSSSLPASLWSSHCWGGLSCYYTAVFSCRIYQFLWMSFHTPCSHTPPPNSRSLTSVISLSIIHTSCHVMLLFHFNILFFCSQLPLVAAQFSVLWTECIVSLFTVTCWYLCLQLQHANTVTHNTIEDDQWPANSFRFTLLGFKLRTVLVSGDC